MSEPIRILFASDLHFGSPSIDQDEMANAFVRTIFPLLEETDIFFINGDFFDQLVSFDNYAFDVLYETIMNLLMWCDKNHVILRILQGTWTHDRNQCRRWQSFYKKSGLSFDFKYVEGIELEEIVVRDRTLQIVYVQDDLPYKTSQDVVDVIVTKLREVGWEGVDYACMHGFFDFTFPSGVSQNNVVVYKEEQFPFVRKLIDVGHVHQHRVVGNVISNGSFDRLNHGDEDPKGCITVCDYPDHYTAKFVENKHAAIFDTLVVTKMLSTEEITKMIIDHVSGIASDRKIFLRFKVENSEHVSAIRAWMKDTYPDIGVAIKKTGEEDKAFLLTSSDLLTHVEKRIAPTPATISTFIRNYIPEAYHLSIENIDKYLVPTAR